MKTLFLFIALLPTPSQTSTTPAQQPGITAKKSFVQKTYSTAKEAATALGAAYVHHDGNAIAKILGDKGYRLISSGDWVVEGSFSVDMALRRLVFPSKTVSPPG